VEVMAGRIENINTDVLLKCREQMGLSLSEVEKKVAKIAEFEKGHRKPTFKQLNILSELYKVPRWVFISERLPEKYQLDKSVPTFRQFSDSHTDAFRDHKVRSLTAKVDRLREMIIELHDDMDETLPVFDPPVISRSETPDYAAHKVRDWLKVKNERFDFSGWKELLEQKGVFVFMTSRYQGWAYIDKTLFRGLTIYHSILPTIIINDSDAKKAQSFTLFHELGHLLKKESAIDDWSEHLNSAEKWCDELAGNVLMPTDQIHSAGQNIGGLDDIKKIAKTFRVSPYACLVRLRQIQVIERKSYSNYREQLQEEYRKQQKKLKDSKGGPLRNRPREILNQYGNLYTRSVFQAYYNKEISLNKLCRLFGLKNPSYILELEGQI
jgi:Zn-dependent peptidase ImmA (M78 family)/transcriptional regulator with XRE-family HTH domain